MKFLFTIQPSLAHLHLIVPIAQALVESGHEAAFAAAESFCPSVEKAGLPCFAAGLDWLAADIGKAFPEWHEVPLAERGRLFDLGVVFAQHCPPPMIDDVLKLAGAWKPDVIIRDIWEFGGWIAAELLEIPYAVIGLSGGVNLPTENLAALVSEPLNRIRRNYGLSADPSLDSLYRYLRLDLIPPSYRPPEIKTTATTHTIRPVSFDQTVSSQPPNWLKALPYQKTVLVTLGTVNNQHLEIFQSIVAGLREEAINVIVTVGPSMEPSLLGQQPSHIRIEQYVPYSLLMDHLDAVVMHGGFTSVMTSLFKGLPLVFVPISADQPRNAARFTQLGAGLTIERSELTAQSIRDAVREVLDDPSYRNAALGIRQELQALPGPEHAAELLTSLARENRPVTAEVLE